MAPASKETIATGLWGVEFHLLVYSPRTPPHEEVYKEGRQEDKGKGGGQRGERGQREKMWLSILDGNRT